MADINNLPFELFEKILIDTDGVTLSKCRSVCKQWKEFIDDNDTLWREMCKKEFKFSSQIAKRKCGNDLSWYYIYRNMLMWPKSATCQKNLRKFYNFSMHDKRHALGIDSSVLPLKEAKGIILYDMSTLKYMPVAVPEKSCSKICNNNIVTVILLKTEMLIQRTAEKNNWQTELTVKADDFVLLENYVYYYNNRDIFKLDLKLENLQPQRVLHCDYDIKEIQHFNDLLHIFTDCGKILTICDEKLLSTKSINCPEEWIKRIKVIIPLDDSNFICYSPHFFQIETSHYRHLYLDFPTVTAIFFYGDIILIGTRAGEILLYRMCSQRKATKPIFEKIAVLPEQKFAVSLDVYERKTGPLVVASTFFELFILDFVFFPEEEGVSTKKNYLNKLPMYKRLLKLKDRLNKR